MRLAPADPPAPTLALVAGVAVQEVLVEQLPGQSVILKWPNDLLVDKAKIAGILLERVDQAVVIGTGVNIAFHPEDIGRPATSIAALNGSAPDAGAFLEMLADRFSRWLQRWRAEGLGPVRQRWLAAAHRPGTALSTSEGEGLFEGLEPDGALRLRVADGGVKIIHAGDVFLV